MSESKIIPFGKYKGQPIDVKVMNRQEEILHQKIAEIWNNNHLPSSNPNRQRLICNWNNAETKRGGNKMVSMGVKKGVSDWQYMADNGKCIWIELKNETGTQSIEQVQFEKLCHSLGHIYVIVRSIDEMWTAINWWPETFLKK